MMSHKPKDASVGPCSTCLFWWPDHEDLADGTSRWSHEKSARGTCSLTQVLQQGGRRYADSPIYPSPGRPASVPGDALRTPRWFECNLWRPVSPGEKHEDDGDLDEGLQDPEYDPLNDSIFSRRDLARIALYLLVFAALLAFVSWFANLSVGG